MITSHTEMKRPKASNWAETEIIPRRQTAAGKISEKPHSPIESRSGGAASGALFAVVILDKNKLIQSVNDAFAVLTGYSAAEVVGSAFFDFLGQHNDGPLSQCIWSHIDKNGYWQSEFQVRHKNGEIAPARQVITSVRASNDRIAYYICSFWSNAGPKQAGEQGTEEQDHLQQQVLTLQDELEKSRLEAEEIGQALNYLMKYRESDKAETQAALSKEIDATVLPLLKNLKSCNRGRIQNMRLIGILEANLGHIISTYGSTSGLMSVYQKLSPVQAQIATMIKNGQSSKVIAAALNISPGTVNIHRKHIRKKLGLDNKPENLQSYLSSLTE